MWTEGTEDEPGTPYLYGENNITITSEADL
jgi:hypothetical protein